AFHLRQLFIKTGPFWCCRSPDGHRWHDRLGIVQCSYTDEDEMGPRLRFAEQVRTAGGAETAVHDIAAFGNAAIVTQLAFDRKRFRPEAGVYSATARADVLTDATPADTSRDGRGRAAVAHGAAKATTGDIHWKSSSSNALVAQSRPQALDVHTRYANFLQVCLRASELLEVGEHVMNARLRTLHGIYHLGRVEVGIPFQVRLAQVFRADGVVISDRLRHCIRQREHQCRDHSGAVLPGHAMEQQWTAGGAGHDRKNLPELLAHL